MFVLEKSIGGGGSCITQIIRKKHSGEDRNEPLEVELETETMFL